MNIVVFEDDKVANLYPITVGRPAMAITCGGSRLIDQLAVIGRPVLAIVRPYLTQLVEADFPPVTVANDWPADVFGGNDSPLLYVNARLVPSVAARERLAALAKSEQPGIVRAGSAVAAAVLVAGCQPSSIQETATAVQGANSNAVEAFLNNLSLPEIDAELPLLDHPHDVLRYHLTTFSDHLTERIAAGDYHEIADGVFVADGVALAEHVVYETADGPIVIDHDASVGPFSYLHGPVYIGPRARVLEHASVRDFVSLGHTTKIGGEVEAAIIEPYTNKQHHGFIGHSYLGSWVNLGAGTCNSDLKNTYGTVNMDYNGTRVPTNMQFVGAIIGDYAKSAINTGFFTGKTVGVCSMAYGFVTTNVPSFVNYARLFGQVTATPVEVMVAAQSRMFVRRSIKQRPCDVQLIHDMYELTRHERELGSVPLEPLSL